MQLREWGMGVTEVLHTSAKVPVWKVLFVPVDTKDLGLGLDVSDGMSGFKETERQCLAC